MPDPLSNPCTAFEGHRLLLSGPLVEVALAVKTAMTDDPTAAILVFDDLTGRVIDLDLRGTKAAIVERMSRARPNLSGRLRAAPPSEDSPAVRDACEPRARGRPRLGVVSREVTLLPRQWEWLEAQPNGASAALRRLVDEARRSGIPQQERRTAHEAAYRFMLAIAGDRAGYEEATRALFADDRSSLERRIADWPKDIRKHVLRLAFGKAG